MGAYGEVRLGTHKRSKLKVAIKRIQIDPKDKDLVEMINNEIKILMQVVSLTCSHVNRTIPTSSGYLMPIRKPRLSTLYKSKQLGV